MIWFTIVTFVFVGFVMLPQWDKAVDQAYKNGVTEAYLTRCREMVMDLTSRKYPKADEYLREKLQSCPDETIEDINDIMTEEESNGSERTDSDPGDSWTNGPLLPETGMRDS